MKNVYPHSIEVYYNKIYQKPYINFTISDLNKNQKLGLRIINNRLYNNSKPLKDFRAYIEENKLLLGDIRVNTIAVNHETMKARIYLSGYDIVELKSKEEVIKLVKVAANYIIEEAEYIVRKNKLDLLRSDKTKNKCEEMGKWFK